MKQVRFGVEPASKVEPTSTEQARLVPAFTVQSRQKNTKIIDRKNTDVYMPDFARISKAKHNPTQSLFRRLYDRGDFPIAIEHTTKGAKLHWKVPYDQIDYARFLPIFCEGLIEYQHPYQFIAEQGVNDLIENGAGKILATIPYIIQPLKQGMTTKDPAKVAVCLKIIQKLATVQEFAGQALVPYYRQLLPTFRLFYHRNCNIGDRIEYGQQKRQNLADLIDETLAILEKSGGPDAFINIKYIIPTYQSCRGDV